MNWPAAQERLRERRREKRERERELHEERRMSSMIPHLFSRAAAAAACAATKIHPATITTLKATAVLRKNSFETSLPSSSSSSSSISCRSVGFASTSDNASPVTPKIVFLGPPGVGKGTYAKKIAKMLDIPHVSLGDLLREEVKLGSALGKEVSDLVEKGQLVPDEIVLDILKQFLRSSNGGSGSDNKIGADAESSAAEQEQELFGRAIKSGGGYVLDGFPRTVKQAEALSEFEQVNLVLNLFLREDVLIEKCLGRRICTEVRAKVGFTCFSLSFLSSIN